MSKYNNRLQFILIAFFICFGTLKAELSDSFIPQPYFIRLITAIIVLFPFAIFAELIVLLYFKFIDKGLTKHITVKTTWLMLANLILVSLISSSNAYACGPPSSIALSILIPTYTLYVVPKYSTKYSKAFTATLGILLFLILLWIIGESEILGVNFLEKQT